MNRTQESERAHPPIHNTLILSDSPESARQLLGDLKRAANRSDQARLKPAFTHEERRGYVLVDLTEHHPSQLLYEREVSPEYLEMMQRVLLLIPHDRCEEVVHTNILSTAQRSWLSTLGDTEVECVLCFEGEPIEESLSRDELEARARDELIASLGYAYSSTHTSTMCYGLTERHHDALYQRLKRPLELNRASPEPERGGHQPSADRISITHIFEGYRTHHTPNAPGDLIGESRGGLLIRALVREGAVKVGDQVEVIGARCRVRSEVRRIECWRERVEEARAGEIITLILSDVLFTEVELGDDVYIISSAEQRDATRERLNHRYARWGWSEDERLKYESAIEMGISLRQLLKSKDPELRHQCLELLLSLEGGLSEDELTALRETLGGLIARHPQRGYFTSLLTRWMPSPDTALMTAIKGALTRLMFDEVSYEDITEDHWYSYLALVDQRGGPSRELVNRPRYTLDLINCRAERHERALLKSVIPSDQPITLAFQRWIDADIESVKRAVSDPRGLERVRTGESPLQGVSRLRTSHELDMKLALELRDLALWRLIVTEPHRFTHLKVFNVREVITMTSADAVSALLNELSERLPELVKVTLDRSLNHELWSALRPYSRLMKLLGDPDETHVEGVTHGESLRALLSAESPDVVHQALELGMALEGYERGLFDELRDLLEGGDPSTLDAGAQLTSLIAHGASRGLTEAVYAALLKLTGRWREVRSLTLRDDPELKRIGLYDELGRVRDLKLAHSDLLDQITDLSQLKHIEITQVERLSSLERLLMCDALESVRSSLELDQLVELGSRPKLLSLLESRAVKTHITGQPREVLRECLMFTSVEEDMIERLSGLHHLIPILTFNAQVKGVHFKMVYCPAGEFWMGSDGLGIDHEQPRHRVEITEPFLIGQTQVTQALWRAVMGSKPGYKTDAQPAEGISWFDCVRFCNALSEATGLEPVYTIGYGGDPKVSVRLDRSGYRLPTEAEWEYMAKAGTELIYAGSNDVDEVAWYRDKMYGEGSRPVGQKKPNAWGIYDCSGNVSEWCSDEWRHTGYQGRTSPARDPHEWGGSTAMRIHRGGDWGDDADFCRVAYRHVREAYSCRGAIGLRVLRPASPIDDIARV